MLDYEVAAQQRLLRNNFEKIDENMQPIEFIND